MSLQGKVAVVTGAARGLGRAYGDADLAPSAAADLMATTLTVAVVDLPDVNAPRVTVMREIELITLTGPIRAQYQIQSRQGALVNRVSDRVQQQIGIQAGDVIVQINRVPITSAELANRILTSYGQGGLRMYFERGGQIYATEFSLQ